MKHITFITDKSKLKGTCYIEIVPDKYQQQHWQDGSLFFTEEAFGFIEPVFESHLNNYNHYGINNIPKNVGIKIVESLNALNIDLIGIKGIESMSEKMYFFTNIKTEFSINFEKNKALLMKMISDVIAWIEKTLNEHNYIAVLGL